MFDINNATESERERERDALIIANNPILKRKGDKVMTQQNGAHCFSETAVVSQQMEKWKVCVGGRNAMSVICIISSSQKTYPVFFPQANLKSICKPRY